MSAMKDRSLAQYLARLASVCEVAACGLAACAANGGQLMAEQTIGSPGPPEVRQLCGEREAGKISIVVGRFLVVGGNDFGGKDQPSVQNLEPIFPGGVAG